MTATYFCPLRIVLFILLLSNFVLAQNDLRLLEAEKPIERELSGGESHAYNIALTPGQFLYVVADQRGIDVVVTLFAPDGKKLFEIDSPNGKRGEEPLWAISETAGNYRLEIVSLEKNAPAGKYEVKIKELRAANADDNLFVAGKKAIAEGLALLNDDKEESKLKAIEKIEKATGRFRQITDNKVKADAILQLGRLYRSLGSGVEANAFFNEAAKLFQDSGLSRDAAISFLNAGQSSSSQTDALSNFRNALILTKAIGDTKLEVSALIEMGRVFYGLGDYPEAVKTYEGALKISREMDYKDKIAAALDNMGAAYTAQSNFGMALECHQKSLALDTELGLNRVIPGTLLNIGNIYESQGNHQQALEFYQKSLTLFENIKANVGIAFSISNIGSVYLNSGEYDKALEYFLKAQEQKTKFLPKDPVSFFNIGLVYKFKGNYPEAIEYFQKSLILAQEAEDSNSIADALNALADVYFLQDNFAKSLEFAENAVKLSERYNYPITYFKALTTNAKVYLARNKRQEARKSLESAITKIESLRLQVAGSENEQENFFESLIEPYKMLIGLSVSENKVGEGFGYAERTKSRTLLDVLQNGKVDFTKAMTIQEKEQERRLKNELVSFTAQLSDENSQQKPNLASLLNLQNKLESKRLEFEDFQTQLYAAHPNLRVQRGDMQPITLEESGKLLPDDKSALLEYVIAEDKAFLFVLTKVGKQSAVSLKVYPIEVKQKDLAEKTESFRSKLAKGDLDFAKDSQDLFNLLLKPAEAQLKNKTNLIIVPDDVLWDLSFQALQPIQNKYLIETSAISYAPSLTALREMKKKNQGKQFSGATLLAFGNPNVGKETANRLKTVFMDEKLEPLPEAERLVNSLQKMYGAQRSKIYVGNEAREETAKTESSKYRIVQFAAHGILNNVSPMYSNIVLSQKADNRDEDGLLEAWEMKDLNLNAEMVILSACETARGRVSNGEGVIGMSWALFIAGVPTTVASQWKVESTSTTELMLEFHRQLLTGKNISKAEALRQASLKLLKNPKYKHPSYWAGFVMVGDGS